MTAQIQRPWVPLVTSSSPVTPARLRAFAAACFVLERAHAAGVVHRGLHPMHISVDDLGDVRVVGWKADVRPTRYAAPELACGPGDARADVYSLGCILFELLAHDRDSAPELHVLCAAATAQVPSARLQTARELGERVLRFVDGERDLALRRELAAGYVARAMTAVEADQSELGAREATLALALDPTSYAAAGVLYDSGNPLPVEVAEMISLDQRASRRRLAVTSMWAFAGHIVFAPALLWFGAGERGYALLLLAVLLLNIGLLCIDAYTSIRPASLWFASANAGLVALIAIVGSPFLFAPGVAAVTVIGLTFNPDVVRARWVLALVVVLCAAVLVPAVAEQVGWLAPTFAGSSDGIMFAPPALRLSDNGRIAFMILYAFTLIGAAAALSFRYVRRERELRYRLYLQLWHVQRHG